MTSLFHPGFDGNGLLGFVEGGSGAGLVLGKPGMLGFCGRDGFVLGISGRGKLGFGTGFPPIKPGKVTGRSNPRKSSTLPGKGRTDGLLGLEGRDGRVDTGGFDGFVPPSPG